MPRPFSRTSSEPLLETPIFKLRRDVSQHPVSGREGKYYVLEAPDWVNTIALTEDNQFLMVRQFRHGIREVTLEMPAGMIEPGEDPVVAAARELREETGYEASKLTLLGETSPNAAFMDNRCFTVLCEGCRPLHATDFDPGEDIEIELIPADELMTLARQGKLRNSLSLVALFWWLERGK
jgi:8-oxo-dGTP pyrophosphatase MutT (NUDIX family)